MVQTIFTYPATLEPDEDGRPVVSFPDLPGAVTDGADEAEALTEAADCLSEALATRITHGEEIPPATPAQPGQHLVSPDPTIALKAALYMKLHQRDMTVADLAELLDMDWHQAARLIDPKRSSKLTSLAAALGALGCRIAVSISDDPTDGRSDLAGATGRAPGNITVTSFGSAAPLQSDRNLGSVHYTTTTTPDRGVKAGASDTAPPRKRGTRE